MNKYEEHCQLLDDIQYSSLELQSKERITFLDMERKDTGEGLIDVLKHRVLSDLCVSHPSWTYLKCTID